MMIANISYSHHYYLVMLLNILFRQEEEKEQQKRKKEVFLYLLKNSLVYIFVEVKSLSELLCTGC